MPRGRGGLSPRELAAKPARAPGGESGDSEGGQSDWGVPDGQRLGGVRAHALAFAQCAAVCTRVCVAAACACGFAVAVATCAHARKLHVRSMLGGAARGVRLMLANLRAAAACAHRGQPEGGTVTVNLATTSS